MPDYKIFTDSAADMPQRLLDKYDITVIPYYVSLNGKDYLKEGEEITQKELFEFFKTGRISKTSLPPIDDYTSAFRPYLEAGKDIICFCLSHKLSGSVQSAANAAEMLKEEFPDRKIIAVDSLQATCGQALVISECARMLENGFDLETVAAKVPELAENSTIMFTLDNLDHLQKGGRIGKSAALLGTILNIKPILTVADAEVMPVTKVRGRKKALDTVCAQLKEWMTDDPGKYLILTVSCAGEEAWEEMRGVLEKTTGLKPNFDPMVVGATIGTHTGPTAIGVSAIKKYEYI